MSFELQLYSVFSFSPWSSLGCESESPDTGNHRQHTAKSNRLLSRVQQGIHSGRSKGERIPNLRRTLGEVVFSGELVDRGAWETSGESVMSGDFSSLKTLGTYRHRNRQRWSFSLVFDQKEALFGCPECLHQELLLSASLHAHRGNIRWHLQAGGRAS